MTSVYPEIRIEVYTTEWVDITADVTGDIEGNYGILSNAKTDRIADVGELNFILNNSSSNSRGVEHYYSPNYTNSLSGWKKGIPVRLRILYGADDIVKWYGHITNIEIDIDGQIVEVECLDYMDYFVNHPLKLVNVASNQRISDVVDLILSGMAIQPLNKSNDFGEYVFTSAFDSIRDNTKAISELNKLVLSEFGWIYIKHGILPETLKTEGRYSRNFLSTLTKIPKNDEYWITEDGNCVTDEQGNRILWNALQTTTFQSDMNGIGLSYGENLVNRVVVKSYPRRIDTSNQVLYSLGTDSPIPLAAGETRFVTGNYRDPNQTAQTVCGKNMVNPTSTTDYLFYQNSDGTGTNLTANLIVSGSYYASSVKYSLTNSGATAGYVTKLQARGTGIYIDSPLTYEVEDTSSINQNGIVELDIDQKYQNSPYVAKTLANTLLTQLKDPAIQVNSVSFLANASDQLMMSFMFLEPGSLVYIKDQKANIDSYFYINGIEFSIAPGAIINFNWILTDALSLSDVIWILGTSKLGSETVLG